MEKEPIYETVAYKELMECMKQYKVPYNEGAPYILLDGILDTSHNLFIQAAIGLAANESYGWNLAFLSDGDSQAVRDIAAAIGAKEIVIRKALFVSRHKKIRYYCDYLKHHYFPNTKSLLSKRMHNIPIGDLVYDSIIRLNKGTYTASQFSEESIKEYIWDAYKNYHAIDRVCKRIDVACITISHKFYTKFGVFARYATNKKIKLISNTRSHLRLISSLEEHYLNDFYINDTLSKEIDQISSDLATDYLKKRFGGELAESEFDVKLSYSSKKDYDLNVLRKTLGLDHGKPIGVIMPHAFSDAPHSDKAMIYNDYYEWLIETLKLVKEINHVEWLIKPHPSAVLYFEEGEVASIVKDASFIKVVPDDIKTTSVFELADAVVTVRGTAGLECVLFNAKPILAGDSYYMDLGFTINCKDVSSYKKALRGIQKKTKIAEELKDKVKKVIYWRNKSFFYYSKIFGPERVPNLPEEEVFEHDLKNYQHVLNYLKRSDYRDDFYYKELLKFFKEDRKQMSGLEFLNDKLHLV